jgi:hypothetical protein
MPDEKSGFVIWSYSPALRCNRALLVQFHLPLAHRHHNPAFAPRRRRRPHNDLDAPPELGQALHEFLFGIAPELPAQEVGKFRLRESSTAETSVCVR